MLHESKSAARSKAYASRWIIGEWLPLELWIAQPRLHRLRSAFNYCGARTALTAVRWPP